MNIHFKLRAQGKSDPIIVLHVFDGRFQDRKFMKSTGKHVKVTQWDKRKQRAKVTSQELDELNKHLDYLNRRVIEFLSVRHNSSSLHRDDLHKHLKSSQKDERKELEDQLQKENEFFISWQNIIDTTKGKSGEALAPGTKRSKEQTKQLVSEFAVTKRLKLTWANLDMKFYQSVDLFMKEKGLGPNSRGKHFKEIKAVMREAFDRDLPVNQSYLKKSFKVIRTSTDSIYLSEDELRRLLTLKLTPAKEVLRDVFVMAAFIGVRHSDWHQIRRENIITLNGRELLKITQTKTKETIHIPVHPVVKTILNKYPVSPKVISNQKFNKALKEIAKHEDLKLGTVSVNGKDSLKSEEISTHTARRSFATNAYLAKMDVYQIMKCTGHRTEASFLKYLKLQGRDYAELAAGSAFFNDQSWNMSVAL